MTAAWRVLWLPVLLGVGGCNSETSRDEAGGTVAQQREARLDSLLAGDAVAPDQPVARWILPNAMEEVSGLALDSAGRLFTHDDERGRVFEVDYRSGALLKEFRLEPEDFEGITIVGQTFYMVTSNGKIYQFREGAQSDRVQTTVHDLRLGRECEFEGIAFEPLDSTFLLPCKNVGGERENQLIIYRWRMGGTGDSAVSPMTVNVTAIMAEHGWERFEPTDITVDPTSGNYLILLGRQQGLLEVSRSGRIVNSGPLPGNFAQAEGIAVTPEGLLIIASEGARDKAVIGVFRRPNAPPAADTTTAPARPGRSSTRS